MAATKYLKLVYDQIWTLLEAHGDWTTLVRPGNRIKLNSVEPFKEMLADGDVPQCTIVGGVAGQFNHEIFTLTPHYGLTNSVTSSTTLSSQSWKERHTEPFTITLTHRDLRIEDAAQLKYETIKALRKGGLRLALSYVHSWGPIVGQTAIGAQTLDAGGNPIGTKRLVTTLNFPVTIWINGQDELS